MARPRARWSSPSRELRDFAAPVRGVRARRLVPLMFRHGSLADLRERQARVDSALLLVPLYAQEGCGGLTFHKVVAPKLGQTPVEAIADASKVALHKALGQLERHWLRDGPFVGGHCPNVADLLFCCEIEQLNMLYAPADGLDIESVLRPFPQVRAWMGRVAGATSPVYEEVHKLLRYASKKRHEAMSKRNAPSRRENGGKHYLKHQNIFFARRNDGNCSNLSQGSSGVAPTRASRRALSKSMEALTTSSKLGLCVIVSCSHVTAWLGLSGVGLAIRSALLPAFFQSLSSVRVANRKSRCSSCFLESSRRGGRPQACRPVGDSACRSSFQELGERDAVLVRSRDVCLVDQGRHRPGCSSSRTTHLLQAQS